MSRIWAVVRAVARPPLRACVRARTKRRARGKRRSGPAPATPTLADHTSSARELFELSEAHIEALEACLVAPQHIRHAQHVLPMLQADLLLWKRVRALSRRHLANSCREEPP